MADEKMINEVMRPVTVNVVGTGDGGITRSTTAITPPDQPDLHVRSIPQIQALAARFAHTFFKTLAALVTAGGATNLIPASDFYHLVLKCASLSLVAACGDAILSLATITSQWAKDHPLLSGEV